MKTNKAKCSRVARVGATLLLGLVCGRSYGSEKLAMKTESFDRDPDWDGAQNRLVLDKPPTVIRDFGYSNTNHAGKASGEIGGKFWQSERPAFYGKVIDAKSFEDPLSMSGRLSLLEGQSIQGWHTSCNVFVGWFSADEGDRLWRPNNFVGFYMGTSNDPDGAVMSISFGTRDWQAGGAPVQAGGGERPKSMLGPRNPKDTKSVARRDKDTTNLFRIPPDGSKHEWNLRYDPKGAGGNGEIVFTFDGGNETKIRLPAALRKNGATLNRFGVFTPRMPGRYMTVFFDDITIDGQLEDFSKDPGWEGVANRERYADPVQYGYSNFGFSAKTSHAGGKTGELGGRFFSCNPQEEHFKAHYGAPVGRLTMDDHLIARGKVAAKAFSTDSSMAMGWFNSKKQGWPIENFIGVDFDTLSDTGRLVQPVYGTQEGTGRQRSPYVTFKPDGTSYDWTLEYDPAAAQGRGAITFTMNNQSVTKPLEPGDKEKGALMDRFGVFNRQRNNGHNIEIYFDDLTYTVGKDAK